MFQELLLAGVSWLVFDEVANLICTFSSKFEVDLQKLLFHHFLIIYKVINLLRMLFILAVLLVLLLMNQQRPIELVRFLNQVDCFGLHMVHELRLLALRFLFQKHLDFEALQGGRVMFDEDL